ARRATAIEALACTMALAGGATLGWLPVLGLLRLAWGVGPAPGGSPSPGAVARSVPELARRLLDPPTLSLATNSLLLGLEAAVAIVVFTWLVRPDSGLRSATTIGSHLIRPLALMPPLLQGVGILAVPWLAALAARSLRAVPGGAALANRLGDFTVELDPDRDPWIFLVFAVSLTVGL